MIIVCHAIGVWAQCERVCAAALWASEVSFDLWFVAVGFDLRIKQVTIRKKSLDVARVIQDQRLSLAWI